MNSTANSCRPVHFLVVDDDDEICVIAIQRAMKKLGIETPLRVACNGIEALTILRESADPTETLPRFVVLLDLSMPRMDGLELLEELRADPALKKLIVFVLTTSDSPRDIAQAYEKNIAGYIVKENLNETLKRAISLLHGYATLVVLPN